MMPIGEQIAILMRGTLFADEVEGADAAARSVEVGAEGRSLREQMTLELRERLKEGCPLRVYLGVDPTSTNLHVGHFVPVQKLRQFQELGHQVVFLIGDYTATIGDPSDQAMERKRFTHEEALALGRSYAQQAFRLLDPDRTEIRYNGEWLAKLTFADIINLAALFPLKWIVSRRDFRDRMERGESLRLHETLYALMQGYDAYALACDVQVGGYDQHFNLLAGRWIQERQGQRPHVMLTLPLLMGTDGRKMSKSYGNAIQINDAPEEMYGKTMRIADEFIADFLDLATAMKPAEIDAAKARLATKGTNPMDVKKDLAAHLVAIYHGAEAAAKAAEHFRQVVQEKSAPDAIEEVHLPPGAAEGTPWVDILVALKLASSKSELRRLIQQGGFYIDQQPVRDPSAAWDGGEETLIRLGKRRYFRILR
ncbi:MAG: tyrosine--tRNA ligase [Candidatus Eisenbacteria bacterium]|nr:tyrosine--tRNA ligase [Candidatus Eisenbacteria bacterium]